MYFKYKYSVICLILFFIFQVAFFILFYYQAANDLGEDSYNIARIVGDFFVIDNIDKKITINDYESKIKICNHIENHLNDVKKISQFNNILVRINSDFNPEIFRRKDFNQNFNQHYIIKNPILFSREPVITYCLIKKSDKVIGYVIITIPSYILYNKIFSIAQGYILYIFASICLFFLFFYKIINLKNKRELETLRVFGKIINMLTTSLAKKSDYTWTHSENVAKYSIIIAEKFGCCNKDIEIIRWAALLHDVGKIGIPETILNKPSKLTKDEYELIKKHPLYGREIISEIFYGNDKILDLNQYKIIIDIITFHHEHWDGNGYPYNLKGEQIPFYARIISVADTLDAILSERPYKNAMTKQEAIEEIKRCSGNQFDPKVVDIFLQCIDESLI